MNTFREKVGGFISKIKSSKKLSLVAVLLLVAAVPLTVFIAQQAQDIRQQASTNQATITVSPSTVTPGDSIILRWSIIQPTTCTNRPNVVRNVTVDNVNKTVNVTATAGTNTTTPTNTLKSIRFKKITNATLEVPTNWTLTNAGSETPIYTFPANTTTVSFKEKRIACGAVTVEYAWSDDCGEYQDFSGAGTGATGLTCEATTPTPTVTVTNTPTPTNTPVPTLTPTPTPTNTPTPSPTPTRTPTPTPVPYEEPPQQNDPNNNGNNGFLFIPRAYAQAATTITGAETFQLFRVTGGTSVKVGDPLYINTCAVKVAGATPPSTPAYSGVCTPTMPQNLERGTYLYTMYATDGTTSLGESNVFNVEPTIPVDTTLDDGLVSYWTMDETTGSAAANSVTSTLNATLGTSNTFVPGKIKNALQNPGTSPGATVPYPVGSALNFSGNSKQSLSFWLKTTSFSQTHHVRLLQPLDPSCGAWGLGYLNNGTMFVNNFCNIGISWPNVVTADSNWHHYAFSYDGINAKLYKDGVLVDTKPFTPNWTSNGRILFIGGDGEHPLQGAIDELGIWNTDLSLEKVQKLFQGNRPSFTTPSVTPTTTPNPTATKFDVKTFLTGIGSPSGTFNPKHPVRPVFISLFDNNNNPVATKTGTITYASASGAFVGTITLNDTCPDIYTQNINPYLRCAPQGEFNLSSGNYTVKIYTPQFLRKQYPGIFPLQPGATIILPNITLTTGDVNLDNKINILDYNFITSCYGSKITSVACKLSPQFHNDIPLADLNDDSVVDGVDYNLFIRSLATKEGD